MGGRLVEEAKASGTVHWRYYFVNYPMTGWTDLDSTGTIAERIGDRVSDTSPPEKPITAAAPIHTLKDSAIDVLISLRMALAKKEGIGDWENDSSNGGGVGIIESPVTSGDVQEIIWGLDQ